MSVIKKQLGKIACDGKLLLSLSAWSYAGPRHQTVRRDKGGAKSGSFCLVKSKRQGGPWANLEGFQEQASWSSLRRQLLLKS